MPLGDCGRHPAVPGDGLVPFHKLSQWLVYSLIEPLADAGFHITDIDGLTGLAEYRNGGLFLDCGVLELRDPGLAQRPLDPFGEPVVEWRALTVILLDRLAERVRHRLGRRRGRFSARQGARRRQLGGRPRDRRRAPPARRQRAAVDRQRRHSVLRKGLCREP